MALHSVWACLGVAIASGIASMLIREWWVPHRPKAGDRKDITQNAPDALRARMILNVTPMKTNKLAWISEPDMMQSSLDLPFTTWTTTASRRW